MDSASITSSTLLPFQKPYRNPLLLHSQKIPHKPHKPYSRIFITSYIPSNSNKNTSNGSNKGNPSSRILHNAAGTLVFTVAATLTAAKFKEIPAMAAELQPPTVEAMEVEEEKVESVENLKALLEIKLEKGEDEETLEILGQLLKAQPSQIEWKFLMARLLTGLGKTLEAQLVLEEILSSHNPSFEGFFEYTLLMDRCGEGDLMISRLEKVLNLVEKAKETRNVRLIMAHILFLKNNLDEALKFYDELVMEDPKDFRPYFCKWIIYSLLHRDAEAIKQFSKYRELSPKKFEVNGMEEAM